MLSLIVVLGALAPAADGFGGQPEPSATATTQPADAECVVQADDGTWHSCAELLEMKAAEREQRELERDGARAPAPPPAQPAAPPMPPPPPKKKTQLQKDAEAAGIDTGLPLVALRIDMEEAREELARMESRAWAADRPDALAATIAAKQLILDDVEMLAIHRMLACSKFAKQEVQLKTIQMTPAGPIKLSWAEIIAQLPAADPYPCARIILVDQEAIDKVRRAHELHETLRRNALGYYEMDKKKQLQAELKALNAWLIKEGVQELDGRHEIQRDKRKP